MSSSLLERWSLTETVRALGTGKVAPAELLERALARISEVEHCVRAWVRIDDDVAKRRVGNAAGPLAGVPLGVKDIIDVAGLPTACGSALRADAPSAAVDAAVVRLLRDAGALPLGKTVTTEFAYFAPGPTRNPARPEHTPGGSSSGSAAAVAAGMVPVALGSQTAGSLTRPAAFCGVAGLVLTTGTVSTRGVVGLSPSLDTVGLLAATPGDLRTAWACAVGGSAAVARSAAAEADADAPPVPRVLVWQPRGIANIDPVMLAAVERAASRWSSAGAKITVLDWDAAIDALVQDQSTVMAFEAARERADELRHAERISEPLAALLRRGASTFRGAYDAAHERIARAGREVADLLGEHDAVLGPAALGPAPEGLAGTGDPVLSRPWQALGLPVVTVPGLRDEYGLPLGLQLIGRRYDEERLLALAAHLGRHLPD